MDIDDTGSWSSPLLVDGQSFGGKKRYQTYPPLQDDRCPAPSDVKVNSSANYCVGAGSMFGHLGTTNFLFVDGHVKALKPTSTIRPLNMWDRENLPITDPLYSAKEAAMRANLTFAENTFS